MNEEDVSYSKLIAGMLLCKRIINVREVEMLDSFLLDNGIYTYDDGLGDLITYVDFMNDEIKLNENFDYYNMIGNVNLFQYLMIYSGVKVINIIKSFEEYKRLFLINSSLYDVKNEKQAKKSLHRKMSKISFLFLVR